jgi:SAM-dependent methyltransferase
MTSERLRLDVFHAGVAAELRQLMAAGTEVLEIGSTDFSFRASSGTAARWVTVDLFPPADILIDLDVPTLRLPLDDSRFHIILCTEVMEHLRFATALLDELVRVLAGGGHLLLSVPNMTSLTYRLAWLMGRIPSCAASADLGPDFNGTGYRTDQHHRWIAGHAGDYNLPRLRALLASRGLSPIRFRGDGLHHRRQIAPPWLIPVSLSSTVLAIAHKPPLSTRPGP